MLQKALISLLFFLLVAGVTRADDLYHVKVGSTSDAEQLADLGVDPVFRGQSGYVVLVDQDQTERLATSNLEVRLLASNITRDRLAIDGRLDRANVGRHPLLYEEDNFRLYLVDSGIVTLQQEQPTVFPVGSNRPAIEYVPSRSIDISSAPAEAEDLQSLIARVQQDSLYAYSQRLEAFFRRVAGSDSSDAARDWLAGKFTQFGYDSVTIDSFQETFYGDLQQCQNVLAYKIGARYPQHHVIIGAHRDAVPGSPGADDNGSGTVGVLEIARALADIETDMTFVFALWDAEEWGLLGARHYLSDPPTDGDSIVYVLNMDMIAFYPNYNYANLYHGDILTFTELWQHLADSLVNINGILSGSSSGSDHYPFAQGGYDVTFAAEYYFSSVYHSYNDSTTYMNFEYMTRMVQASLATVYMANLLAEPVPRLAFTYPDGVPTMIDPDRPTSFEVDLGSVYYGVPVPGSGMLHYSVDGGDYVTAPMTDLGGWRYLASLPAVDCLTRFRFFVSAEEETGRIFYDPGYLNPHFAVVATDSSVLFNDNFDTDQGWLTTYEGTQNGLWERAIPVDDQGWKADPPADADGGDGMCFVTDNGYGSTDVDFGEVRLWSPIFDMTEGGIISYDYYLYLSNDDGYDRLLVEINDYHGAGEWYEVARHDTHGGLTWRHNEITAEELILAGASLTPYMRLRFSVNDGGSESIVEAGVDNVFVATFDCQPCCGLYNAGMTGNTNCSEDGKVTLADISTLIDRIYISQELLCCEANGNANGSPDGLLTLSDISRLIDHVYISKAPAAPCP